MLSKENIFSKFLFYLINYTNVEKLNKEASDVEKLDRKTKVTVVISAYNEGNVLLPEKSNLYHTHDLFRSQIDFDGKPISKNLFMKLPIKDYFIIFVRVEIIK